MKLIDYNNLAYEFAIRNPRVIELFNLPLTDAIVKELLTFGFDATSEYNFGHGLEQINSLQELYLDYKHLKHINHYPHSPYGEPDFMGNKILVHPLNKVNIICKESDEDAICRIQPLIEARGKKLRRLIDGTAFKNYDALIYFDKTIYSLDPTTNTAKTIRDDKRFISMWIQPDKYLQLIPQYINITDYGK